MRRQDGWLTWPAIAVMLSVAAAACTFGKGEPSAATARSVTTMTSARPGSVFVRTCAASVYGTLDDPTWRKHSAIAGPLIFYSAGQYAEQPASLFTPTADDDRYAGQKLLVLIQRGAVATVTVPESERNYVSLLYNPAAWNDRNTYRIEDGESAVTFKACKKGESGPRGRPLTKMTQFNGGLAVAGARCVPLEVQVRGQEGKIPVTLSFGAGHCA